MATILDASQTKSIIASRDIFDVSGIKLWARDQPVSQALQRKLLDRQLRQPLEACLIAEDGVNSRQLLVAVEQLLEQDTPLKPLLAPHADDIVHAAVHLPLHPVAQLLLTAGQASRPDSFDHAIQAMALCGALTLAHGGGTRDLRVAMLCGLLHDLGEMYIDPHFGEADADRTLDVRSYQQLVVHPHVGKLLIEQLTNYPPDVARAIAEHHEKLDGTGYPHCLAGDQVSPLGRMLAATEGTLAALRKPQAHLSHASVALRAVPGEYDLAWIGPIAHAARVQPVLQASMSVEEVSNRLETIGEALRSAQSNANALIPMARSEKFKSAVMLAQHLLARLRLGWNASGLWSPEAVSSQDAAEVQAIEDELLFRLRSIQRAALLCAGQLADDEAALLNTLCEGIAEATGG
ncbi:HD domain-containing protein [Albitalea terrae]|uniref:HD domain-containing protein n=1 Tax=Piscinibacter terrae TaxID=2496871 RepID=A0A3N7J3V0_9BURK|nr:HD domain-containing protein [Albitalea terrae]